MVVLSRASSARAILTQLAYRSRATGAAKLSVRMHQITLRHSWCAISGTSLKIWNVEQDRSYLSQLGRLTNPG
jgi:hypothetical protein